MTESISTHIILCQCLCFTEGKTRTTNITEKSKFLSSLALLLNGNASCTAVYVHLANKSVFIARNEPVKPADQRYFDRFFRQIRIYANLCFDKDKAAVALDAKDQLESCVLEYNSKKIIYRFATRNSVDIYELRKMAQWDINEKAPFIAELRSNPKLYRDRPSPTEKFCLISKNYTEEDYVQFLFEKLNEFLVARDQLLEHQLDPTDQHLILATGHAVGLYQSRLFQFILNNSKGTADKGVYYFEKISAHKRSIGLVLKCLLFRKDSIGEIYKNIDWRLVTSIEERRPLRVTPRQAFENIFTNLSHSSDQNVSNALQNATSDAIYDQHLQQLKRFDDDPVHDVCLHAEILLIDYLLKNNIDETHHSKEVEIGISKMPCLLCSYYIDALNKKYDRYFFQRNSTNGKIYAKWTYRCNEDSSILTQINEKLINKIQQSIQKLCLESDRTGPHKSGDSDIMFTSIECDEFDKKQYDRIWS